jgi:hypothetical protein
MPVHLSCVLGALRVVCASWRQIAPLMSVNLVWQAGSTKVLSKADQFAKKGLSTKGMSSMASFFKPKPK